MVIYKPCTLFNCVDVYRPVQGHPISNLLMANTTTIAASGVPLELVQWLDEQAKQQCTNRSTIIRQILTQRVAEESVVALPEGEKEAA